MPEGDTIHAAAARVRATLGPGPIRSLGGSRLSRHVARLVDEPVDTVWSHGKHLIIESGDWAIRAHLGMHGRWTTHAPDRPPRPGGSLRALLGTDEGVAACWSAPDVVVDRAPAIRRWLGTHLGPDLIRTDPDGAAIAAGLSRDTRVISDVLLDQRIAAGIGNVYKSELCFRAGVNPFTAAADLKPDQVRSLYEDAAALLRMNSHRRDRLTTGIDRTGQRLWVYGRPGRGCRRCNTPVQRDGLGERVTFWCPACQPAF